MELSRKQPRFLLIWFQKMIIMLFISNLAQAWGENISPGNFSPAEAINFSDCIQYSYFSIFATQCMIARTHAFGWLFRIESTTLVALISLLAFHKMPLLLQKMDKNQNGHPSFPDTAIGTIKNSVWVPTVS